MSIVHRVHILIVGLLTAMAVTVSGAAVPATQPLPDAVDDGVFYEALRHRGLAEWSRQCRQDVMPEDAVAVTLAKRETLLERAASLGRSPEQVRSDIVQASELLNRLIDELPDHPGRYRWQFELARDYLERQQAQAFEFILLYELPGQDANAARDLAGRAVETLAVLRQQITAAWRSVESLEEQAVAAARTSGTLTALEMLDAQSVMLLTWGRLYATLANRLSHDDKAKDAGRPVADATVNAFADVLDSVMKSGWLELPPGRESEQAGALVIAAIAERHLGRTKHADGHARQVIAVLNNTADRATRQRLRRTTLLAVLEQVRASRDAGQFDAALASAEQARQWCIKSRPDDAAALVAVSILESHVRHCKQVGKVSALRESVGSWLTSAESLAPLDMLVRRSPAHLDLLYAVLASSLKAVNATGNSVDETTSAVGPLAVQLLVGSAVAAASAGHDVDTSRLRAACKLARDTLAGTGLAEDVQRAGELRYLLGQSLAIQRSRPEAVQVLAEFVEKQPTHDRADAAARLAVSMAAEDVRNSGPVGTDASRAMFVKAARVLRHRNPADASAVELSFAIGVALENGGRYEEAAGEYALVPPSHARWSDAALGLMRCWRQVLEQASATSTGVSADVSPSVDRARSAARAVGEVIAGRSKSSDGVVARPDSCEDGKLILALAELLNQPALGGAERAFGILGDFEKRFAECPQMLGPVLRQRILSLRQLKRLPEARTVLDRYVLADPDNAGTAMAGLLQALHDEMHERLRRGDKQAASATAAEAVPLGRLLLDWVSAHAGAMTPANVRVVQLWYAASLLQAGRPEDALAVYDTADSQDDTAKSPDLSARTEMRLGRADALLALGRTSEALTIYDRVWAQAAEASESWWHALTGSLMCHACDPKQVQQVLQSIRQQRYLFPDFDGGRYKHELSELERSLAASSTQLR